MSAELALILFLYVAFVAMQLLSLAVTRHCRRWMEYTDRQIGYLTELHKMHNEMIASLQKRIEELEGRSVTG